ncbi:hypothetical protein PANDA_004645 [Ailuropoda melanoleuca]|uniref:Uncharacterized protein n=1 Tax=Ailuropoda melanoleuca TaxID=9646 RepID=D2H4D8_AILME|nr:hypothetical protein PANDA_004645 [Ailuropoda melanoleuca]
MGRPPSLPPTALLTSILVLGLGLLGGRRATEARHALVVEYKALLVQLPLSDLKGERARYVCLCTMAINAPAGDGDSSGNNSVLSRSTIPEHWNFLDYISKLPKLLNCKVAPKWLRKDTYESVSLLVRVPVYIPGAVGLFFFVAQNGKLATARPVYYSARVLIR